jgi:Protein of unknown function (DUF 659)
MKFVDAAEKYKNTNYISSLMLKVIEEVGVSCVVQIIFDNGSNFKAAGRIIMEKYNHIFWTSYATHCIDLMLEDIGKDNLIRDIVQKVHTITILIYNHQWVLNLMHEVINNRELLRPGITRFATNFIALQSIYTFKDAPLEMCLKPNWDEQARKLRTRKKRCSKCSRSLI